MNKPLGRRKGEPTTTLAIRIRTALKDELRRTAKESGCEMTEIVVAGIRAEIARVTAAT